MTVSMESKQRRRLMPVLLSNSSVLVIPQHRHLTFYMQMTALCGKMTYIHMLLVLMEITVLACPLDVSLLLRFRHCQVDSLLSEPLWRYRPHSERFRANSGVVKVVLGECKSPLTLRSEVAQSALCKQIIFFFTDWEVWHEGFCNFVYLFMTNAWDIYPRFLLYYFQTEYI